MTAMKIFLLFLFFALTSARYFDNIDDADKPDKPGVVVEDESPEGPPKVYEEIKHLASFVDGDGKKQPRTVEDESRDYPADGEKKPLKVEDESRAGPPKVCEGRCTIEDQKNVVTVSNSPPASDGSYIQIYQKNEYHNNGSPAKLMTIYKKCSGNGTCKNIHYLELAF